MKKKIFTLLTLLLAVCSGAWADTETIYSWVSTGNSSTVVTETGGTASGKFATVTNYCMQLADKYSALKTKADNHITITLSNNATFKEGDVITVKGYYSKGESKKVSLAILPDALEGSTDGTDYTNTTGLILCTDTDWPDVKTTTFSTKEHSYTLTSAYNGKTAITLTRNSSGTNLDLASVVITREVDNNPTLTVTYATANISESGSGVADPSAYISTASVALSGSNAAWGSGITYNNVTYASVSTSNTTTADDKMTFTIIPKKGVTFTPKKVSFGAIRSGTDGGKMTVKANSTTLTSTDKPGRNNGTTENGYEFSYNISSITTTKASPLTITIAMVGMSGTRGWGIADLVVEGTYTGEPEAVSSYTVATSVSPSGAGSITQSPAGTSFDEETAVSFTATANAGYAFVNWTDNNNGNAVLGTNATYSIASLSANTDITANFKALTAVTFSKGDAYGEVPTTQYGDGTVQVTMPTNKTLYKDGYTLTGWNDGTSTYAIGDSHSFTENTTLTPVFTQNTVSPSDYTAATTVTWNFGKSNGAPSYTGVESANVKQVTIAGSTIDLGIKMPGGSNSGRNDEWMNTQNKDYVVPVSKGAVISTKLYYASGSVTFNGETFAYDSSVNGSEGNVNYSYTYTGNEDAITVNLGNQFVSYISVVYPKVEKRTESDLTITSATEVELDATTTTAQITATTSATIGLTYTSSNTTVATVSSTGLITAVANGTATITVAQEGDAVYMDDSKTITVTVNNGVTPSYSIDAILNDETGTKLESGEMAAQGNAFSFGINSSNERVAVDAADAVVSISGKYYNDHGSTEVTATVKATGNMKFTLGNCTYNNSTATLKNASNETLKAVDLRGTGCWKGSHTDVTTFYYEGDAATLTLTVPSYIPYIKVESVNELPKFAVTFKNGDETVETKQIIEGEGLGTLPTPTYDSSAKYFVGWFSNTSDPGTKALASTVPTAATTYYALFIDVPTTTAGYYTPQNGVELFGLVSYLNSSNLTSAKIFLKNGTYDWGTAAETQLTKSNISIIGESLDGTILTTIPAQEGLGTATLLYNKGQYNYLQDITLHNNYPYGNSTGRAASLKDEGNYTICKNVWLYSHQDTYYSHSTGAYFYFNGGKISGCVDYMCGQSRVYYDGVTLSNDNRGTTMTANSELYVFNNCVIENGGQTYNFGRAWSGEPVCVFLNTTLEDGGSKLAKTRWSAANMNTTYVTAGEYGTMDAAGNVITPASNEVQFTYRVNNQDINGNKLETILTAEQAATYTMDYTLGSWAATAASDVVQATVTDVSMTGSTLSWTGTSDAYLIENNGEFVALTTETSYVVAGAGKYTVRAANGRGGFGEAVAVPTVGGEVTFNLKNASFVVAGTTQDDVTFAATSASATASYLQIADSGERTITISATAPKRIAKVVLTFTGSGNDRTGQLSASPNAEGYSVSGVTGTWISANAGGDASVTFTAANKGRLETAVVTYVEAEAVSTLAERNYGTCVTASALDFTDVTDAKAYIASGFNNNKNAIVLKQVNKVAANTPLIIYTTEKDAAATIYVPKTLDDPDAAVAENDLVAGDGTTAWNGTTGYTYYYLASDLFHKATSGTLQSGKAYLKVDNDDVPTEARQFGFVFDNEAQGISASLMNNEEKNNAYDLQGRRVAQPTKGLYIVNGKKVIVK